MKEAGFHAIKKFFKLFHNFFSLGHIFALLARKLSKYQQRASIEAAKGMPICPMPIAQCPKLKILDSIMQKNQIDQFFPKYLFLSQKANEPKKAFLDEEFFGTETLVAWFAFFHLVTEQGHQIYTFPSLLSRFIRV